MKSTILGYPRIGEKRELKKALENYWKKTISEEELSKAGKDIREKNWKLQQEKGIDFIPSNDFSLYDQVLDMSVCLGCIPERFQEISHKLSTTDLYFAMARGLQKEDIDVTAMEMTKWFDTNYHYIVPEFSKNQQFELNADKLINEYKEAFALGIQTKPVIIGPVTYLCLGKESSNDFDKLDLLDALLPVYLELLTELHTLGVDYIQIDEPILSLELSEKEKRGIRKTYELFAEAQPKAQIILTNYFNGYEDNLETVLELPVAVIHFDLVRCAEELEKVIHHSSLQPNTIISLGVVDGRNIWKNNYEESLALINKAKNTLGAHRIWIASSCSLLHTPFDLDLEANEQTLPKEVKTWLAFAKQKLEELEDLKQLVTGSPSKEAKEAYIHNQQDLDAKKTSTSIHNREVKNRVANLKKQDSYRISSFKARQEKQRKKLNLPLYPTTTIGSFPQTKEVRSWRAQRKKNKITEETYNHLIAKETAATIKFQEEIGIDVLVHGEFERNDMVEYFGEKLNGFAFTTFGWVQSYGSRCVKPPIIYGDVSRENPMTVKWSSFAQSLTKKPVKGMLTGPITILQWSFVRNDQPRATTCKQIALAIRDEVVDLEKAGIKIIQIDEPAIREGLPLRKKDWKAYLDWAVTSFRISASGVQDETQIHTHMCYSEFNDIIENIAALDADVITIETSRSNMELLDAFVTFKYPNEIGPGVYDIHSPRVPKEQEIELLLDKASKLLPVEHIWVNPDCGLKTRDWPETKQALVSLVSAAKKMRNKVVV